MFGKEEVSLRDAIRSEASDDELVNLVQSALYRKKKQHAGAPILLLLNKHVCIYLLITIHSPLKVPSKYLKVQIDQWFLSVGEN